MALTKNDLKMDDSEIKRWFDEKILATSGVGDCFVAPSALLAMTMHAYAP